MSSPRTLIPPSSADVGYQCHTRIQHKNIPPTPWLAADVGYQRHTRSQHKNIPPTPWLADAHENDHVKYCTQHPGACSCSGGGGCGIQTFNPGNAGNDSECRAFGVSIRCMADFTKPKVCDNLTSIGCRVVTDQCKYLLGNKPYGDLGLLKCKPDKDVLEFCHSIGIY